MDNNHSFTNKEPEFIDPYASMEEPDLKTEDSSNGSGPAPDTSIYAELKPNENGEYQVSDILNAITTPKDSNRPCASAAVVSSVFRGEEDDLSQKNEFVTGDACVSIERRGSFVVVGLNFPHPLHEDLTHIWYALTKFGEDQEKYIENDDMEPAFDLFLMPITNPNIIMSGNDPVFWSLQPPAPGMDVTMISILFLADNINFSVSDADVKQLEEEMIKEIEKETEEINQENKILQEAIDQSEQTQYGMISEYDESQGTVYSRENDEQ